MGSKSKYNREEKISLVQQCLNGGGSIESFAKSKGINGMTLRYWIRNYQSIGIDCFNRGKYQSYSEEFKLQAVQEYLSGKGSLAEICKKFKIKSKGQLRNWILRYNNHEPLKSHTGGKRRTMVKGRETTFEERIEIVRDHMESGVSYGETAEKHGVSYQQVYQWVQKYQKHGLEGLRDRRGKRKAQEDMTESERLRAELKMEKAKNRNLELEAAFLKKLKEIERRRY